MRDDKLIEAMARAKAAKAASGIRGGKSMSANKAMMREKENSDA